VFDGIGGRLLRQSRIELAEEEVNALSVTHRGPRAASRDGPPCKLYINSVTFALPLLEEEAHPVDLL